MGPGLLKQRGRGPPVDRCPYCQRGKHQHPPSTPISPTPAHRCPRSCPSYCQTDLPRPPPPPPPTPSPAPHVHPSILPTYPHPSIITQSITDYFIFSLAPLPAFLGLEHHGNVSGQICNVGLSPLCTVPPRPRRGQTRVMRFPTRGYIFMIGLKFYPFLRCIE